MLVSEEATINWVWWITAVEVPALGCLFWLTHHARRESERALLRVYREIQTNLSVVLENLPKPSSRPRGCMPRQATSRTWRSASPTICCAWRRG